MTFVQLVCIKRKRAFKYSQNYAMSYTTQEYDSQPGTKRRRSSGGYGGRTYIPRGPKYVAPGYGYRKKVPKSVRTYVKSAITRSVESKRAFVNAANTNIYAEITQAQCISLVPSISQGTTQGTRVGNCINLKKVTVRMMVQAALNSYAPLYADIYVFRRKPNASIANIDTNFLQAGNTSVGYDSDALAYCGMLSLNEDLYEQKVHRRVKIWNPNATANQGVQASIDPTFMMTMDVTRFLKKKVTYNDGTPTPTSDDVYFAVATSYSNGASSAGVATATMAYVIETEYSDS